MTFILKQILKKLGWRSVQAVLTAGLSYLQETMAEDAKKKEAKK